jgi:4,5-DOPA dioxygenase extradiol
MHRKTFLTALALTPLATLSMQLNALRKLEESLQATSLMPALFIGHGSPTNALEKNEFVTGWQNIARQLPKPQAILCISAHWETKGSWVTAMPKPKTIHDFGGFSQALFDINYPAPGSPKVAQEVQQLVQEKEIGLDHRWGLDHGCWVPLLHLFPEADVPVLQLSLDITQSPAQHYALGKALNALRKKGVLIIGSGNMVHNFQLAHVPGGMAKFNEPYGHDWALEINEVFKRKIAEYDHQSMINYQALGTAARLAVPTPEHYLPLLYILGLQGKSEAFTFFNDQAVGGSFTMTSLLIHNA